LLIVGGRDTKNSETIGTQAETPGQRPIVEGMTNYRILGAGGLASEQGSYCGCRFAEEILCGVTARFETKKLLNCLFYLLGALPKNDQDTSIKIYYSNSIIIVLANIPWQ